MNIIHKLVLSGQPWAALGYPPRTADGAVARSSQEQQESDSRFKLKVILFRVNDDPQIQQDGRL